MGAFKRRRFLATLGALLAPELVCAQQAGRVYRVGSIFGVSPLVNISGPHPKNPVARGFVEEMQKLGYTEGKNLALDLRSAEGNPERYAPILAELHARKADVIVIPGIPELVKLAIKASTSVPIVCYSLIEPVKLGLVKSLAHPGGNLSGLTIISGFDNETKRLQLLKETIPAASRVVYLASHSQPAEILAALAQAARSLGVDLVFVMHEPTDFERTRAEIVRQRPDALVASLTSTTYGQRDAIIRFVIEARLPGVFPYSEMAEAGGLVSYAIDVSDLGRKAAHYVDRIFKGAKPGDLPIEQPTRFELTVNLKTARALGLTIPQSILLRADRAIE